MRDRHDCEGDRQAKRKANGGNGIMPSAEQHFGSPPDEVPPHRGELYRSTPTRSTARLTYGELVAPRPSPVKIFAIVCDPNWRGGDYYDTGGRPLRRAGQRLLAILAMARSNTFRSQERFTGPSSAAAFGDTERSPTRRSARKGLTDRRRWIVRHAVTHPCRDPPDGVWPRFS
jgi:hypothetical protein